MSLEFRVSRIPPCLIILAILLTPVISATASDISINGFMQGNYSSNINRASPSGSDFKWAGERLQLKINAEQSPFYLFLKADFSYDHIDDDPDHEIREAYMDYLADTWDMRIGRQIITWGVGDLIFINDIFPKDYEAFFSGRPMEYLKIGSDAIKIGLYPESLSAELVIIPFFRPARLPRKTRFHQYDPMPQVTERHRQEPASTPDNTEIALRLYRSLAGYDTSIYIYKGVFKQPAMRPDNFSMPARIDLIYPRLSVYGASIQGTSFNGILSLEAGYYDSREDRDGSDPVIPNQSIKFLIGYQKQIWEDFTAGIQYHATQMLDYDEYRDNVPTGLPDEKEWQDILTVRLTHLFRHQTLKVSFFSFWSPADGDYLIIPEISYDLTDHLRVSAGANIFGGGDEWNQFGSLDDNDNIYMHTRYEF